MRIIRVDNRYFLAETQRDIHDIALKVLNEHRNLGGLDEKTKGFVGQVCDEMDGDTAAAIISRWHDVDNISPEVI